MEKSDQITTKEKIIDRIFKMVSVGVVDDKLNQGYDILSTVMLLINLFASFAMTFEDFYAAHRELLNNLEAITVFFFAVDYVLRVITAQKLYPEKTKPEAVLAYMTSGYGIIDLLSFLPYYLPVFFPAGSSVFRMLRVVRIFRLFRINSYLDSLSIIGRVISGKKTQLMASVFIIFMLILASSLCMYSVEHDAQPDVFKNAFSGIWWATSTLLTVGYGDIYPITTMGQILGILITFLGVGLVAIPTGIISAGFVEEYQRAKRMSDIERQESIHFIETEIKASDRWAGKKVRELGMPRASIIAAIVRKGDTIIPRGNVEILAGDKLIICAESVKGDYLSDLREVELKRGHSWNGQKIKDIDLSRQSFIILIDRNKKMLVPDGELVLMAGDIVLIYTKENRNKYAEESLF